MTGPPVPSWTNRMIDADERDMRATIKKPEDWKIEQIHNYRDILQALRNLKNFLDKEDPTSLFVWTVESKIRAYDKKLRRLSSV